MDNALVLQNYPPFCPDEGRFHFQARIIPAVFTDTYKSHLYFGPCELCQSNRATDPHHCIYHRDIRKPELDSPLNIAWLCRACHTKVHQMNRYYRQFFWERKCEKHGWELMCRWHEWLPLKVKERFE